MSDRPKLGFRQLPDDRDDHYPLSLRMKAVDSMPISKVWRPGPVNDQGNTNGCVGYSTFKFLTSEPVVVPDKLRITEDEIYLEARRNDEWPGEADEGTSVRAGLEVLRAHGFIGNYFWSRDYREAVEYMLTTGPLVLGVNWYESMFTPNSKGVITPYGQLVGGHAIFAYVADWPNRMIALRGTWGEEFGFGGDCLLSFTDFDRLLKEDGVCAAVSEPIPA